MTLILDVREAKGSLEHFQQAGNKLILIGNGIVKSPGHPAGNQQYCSQMDFLRLLYKNTYVAVNYRKLDGTTLLMGEYYFKAMAKRQSFEGFTYFEYTFIRTSKGITNSANVLKNLKYEAKVVSV